jgi:hypothetical protein
MRTALLSLTFLLAGSMVAPAFAHTAAPKKKVTATTKKGKILPMKEYIDQLMAKMTLQEKIGQLNLMVAGDITTGGALDTQVGSDIAQGNMGGVFNIKGIDKIKALQEIAIKNSRLGIPLLVGMDVIHGYETMFPIPLALSCSWDTEAMKKVGEVSAKEASADGINWTFSPMVDIAGCLTVLCGINLALAALGVAVAVRVAEQAQFIFRFQNAAAGDIHIFLAHLSFCYALSQMLYEGVGTHIHVGTRLQCLF